jgi:hypothetical protein
MKIKLIVLIVLLITTNIIARVIIPFDSWNQLQDASPYIIIAKCGKPILLPANVMMVGATKSDSEILIISVLKGTTNAGLTHLQTDHELKPGENYLIFGYYNGGIYRANEEYRVIPLGVNFSISLIVGKTLDEQVQILLQRRLDNLNQQMKDEEEEKQRLEEGVKK